MENRQYRYNDCGDMVEKREADGKVWQYFYHPGGLMEKVVRPDGKEVNFAYDPLGRRISKEFDKIITKYLWDGNLIVHEWVEEAAEDPVEQNKESNVFSWLYEDGTFTPIAKLTRENAYSVISDHLGTPNTLINENRRVIWKTNLDIYGNAMLQEVGEIVEGDDLIHLQGHYHSLNSDYNYEKSCNFRFPGQYEDVETGLYYNRFRYYMPNEGIYTQCDPIGLTGGNPTIYGYVHNSLMQIDPFGLNLYDILPYKMRQSGFELHHAIMDAWGKANITNYSSRNAPAIVLTEAQHNATRSAFNTWKHQTFGASNYRSAVNWSNVSARDIQRLNNTMLDAANVPQNVGSNYIKAFNQYIYEGKFTPLDAAGQAIKCNK